MRLVEKRRFLESHFILRKKVAFKIPMLPTAANTKTRNTPRKADGAPRGSTIAASRFHYNEYCHFGKHRRVATLVGKNEERE